MSQILDVIVVGAGPGGSNAAAVALQGGLSVAQLDKEEFPRVKPCGGGITIKACNAIQYPMDSVQRGEFREVEFNVCGRRTNRFTHVANPVLRMIDRPQFDNWLVEQNMRHPGFVFYDGEKVIDIEYAKGVFRVQTSRQLLMSRNLVGADGAYSLVNKIFQVTHPKGYAVAVEVVISRNEATLSSDIPPCFDFGAVPSGYGWVFPKDDHWNVGLYTLGKAKDLRRQLQAYIQQKGFRISRGDPLSTFVGHQVPYGGYKVNVPDAPVYIVGDAGGYADPIMGEGIYHALESGRIAGRTIVDCAAGVVSHKAYYKRIRRTVLADTFVTYHIAREFYRNVDKAITILENPFVWRPFVQGYSHGATFAKTLIHGGLFLSQSLVGRTLRHDLKGDSPVFSLWGPLRGVLYIIEPFLRRFQRYLGLAP
jgi:geranylgeranyl reductase family protein